MEVLIFIVVIVVLIVVHEFGHFVVAKLCGMRVDEFGLGYPPRALRFAKIGETEYTLNWLPFGGFVKIYGEDGGAAGSRAFSARPRLAQAATLVAGVAMNLVLAYVLIAAALVAGTPRALAPGEVATARGATVAVSGVIAASPAARAGLEAGDTIVSATDARGSWSGSDPVQFSQFVAASEGEAIELSVKRGSTSMDISATPAVGVAASDPSRYALGVEVATIGVVPLALLPALSQAASLTWGATVLTAEGLWHFFASIFTLHADFSQVAGPIGIAGAVGSATASGLGDLLSLMALISINLALINLIPVPALDGGRLLFVGIEAVIRRPINPAVAGVLNRASFALLILLMLAVSLHDVYRIVS